MKFTDSIPRTESSALTCPLCGSVKLRASGVQCDSDAGYTRISFTCEAAHAFSYELREYEGEVLCTVGIEDGAGVCQ